MRKHVFNEDRLRFVMNPDNEPETVATNVKHGEYLVPNRNAIGGRVGLPNLLKTFPAGRFGCPVPGIQCKADRSVFLFGLDKLPATDDVQSAPSMRPATSKPSPKNSILRKMRTFQERRAGLRARQRDSKSCGRMPYDPKAGESAMFSLESKTPGGNPAAG
jgi:hypothetical protein